MCPITCPCMAPTTDPSMALRFALLGLGVQAFCEEPPSYKGELPIQKYNYRLIPMDFTIEFLRGMLDKMSGSELEYHTHKLGGWFFYLKCPCGSYAPSDGFYCWRCEKEGSVWFTRALRLKDSPPTTP